MNTPHRGVLLGAIICALLAILNLSLYVIWGGWWSLAAGIFCLGGGVYTAALYWKLRNL